MCTFNARTHRQPPAGTRIYFKKLPRWLMRSAEVRSECIYPGCRVCAASRKTTIKPERDGRVDGTERTERDRLCCRLERERSRGGGAGGGGGEGEIEGGRMERKRCQGSLSIATFPICLKRRTGARAVPGDVPARARDQKRSRERGTESQRGMRVCQCDTRRFFSPLTPLLPYRWFRAVPFCPRVYLY